MPEIVRVKCPHCDTEFDTGAVGDVRNCWGCDEQFNLYTNIIDDD